MTAISELSPITGIEQMVTSPGLRALKLGEAADFMDGVWEAAGIPSHERERLVEGLRQGQHHNEKSGNPQPGIPEGTLTRRQIAGGLTTVFSLEAQLNGDPKLLVPPTPGPSRFRVSRSAALPESQNSTVPETRKPQIVMRNILPARGMVVSLSK